MGGHVLRVTFEPCRLYGDGRKSGGGGALAPVSDAYAVYNHRIDIYERRNRDCYYTAAWGGRFLETLIMKFAKRCHRSS